MSADNGIYILETEGPEYRVRELQAVENVDWDHVRKTYTQNEDVRIGNARRMWHNGEMFTDRTDALIAADKIWQTIDFCEYGICFIKIDRRF